MFDNIFKKEEELIKKLYTESSDEPILEFGYDVGIIPINDRNYVESIFKIYKNDSDYTKYMKNKLYGLILYNYFLLSLKINSTSKKKKKLNELAKKANISLLEADKILGINASCSLLVLKIDNILNVLNDKERKSLIINIFGQDETHIEIYELTQKINKEFNKYDSIFQEIDGLIDLRHS